LHIVYLRCSPVQFNKLASGYEPLKRELYREIFSAGQVNMFSLLSGCFEFMTHKEEMHLLIVGLDRSGKTTLLERLKGAYTDSAGLEPERILPTVGLNIARFQVGPVPVVAWDLGGAAPLRSIWEKYYHESQAVLYLIDAADVARVEEAKLVMDRLLGTIF
jgi:ADP-ribosylation factor related protein 1